MKSVLFRQRWSILVLVCLLFGSLSGSTVSPQRLSATERVIVQASSVTAATALVDSVGGRVIRPLGLINAVNAELSARAAHQLAQLGVRITPDYPVRSANDTATPETGQSFNDLTLYPSVASGSYWLDSAINGQGITVAFVDSGFPAMTSASDWTTKVNRNTLYRADPNRFLVYHDLLWTSTSQMQNSSDPYGHGTHVAMTVADARKVRPDPELSEKALGIAPKSNIVMVRALDDQGQSVYSNVIAAVDWIVSKQAQYQIRVLNLSLDGVPAAPYWYDPLGQAVMRAWQAGIVVVASAGNRGTSPLTIGVPGNVPYVITVGAIKSAQFTTSGYDELAAYSSVGPTESRFIKPDVLVPATRLISTLPKQSTLVQSGLAGSFKNDVAPEVAPGKFDNRKFGHYRLSGTSMAAAEVSGIVALILQRQPNLTNNQVKYRLTSTALAAGTSNVAQYSVWQQGAGRVNPYTAVMGASTEAANQGLNLALDLGGEFSTHYMGPTAYNPQTQQFYIEGQSTVDPAGYNAWAGGYNAWAGGYNAWAGGYNAWAGGYNAWAGGYNAWAGGYNAWAGGYNAWAGGYNAWAGRPEVSAEIIPETYSVYLPFLR